MGRDTSWWATLFTVCRWCIYQSRSKSSKSKRRESFIRAAKAAAEGGPKILLVVVAPHPESSSHQEVDEEAMDASKVRDLRQLVEAWQKDPASLIADPSLAFFRDYLQSLGAEIPTFNKPKGKSKKKEQSSSHSSGGASSTGFPGEMPGGNHPGGAMPGYNLWAVAMKDTDGEKDPKKDERHNQAYALEQERIALEQVRARNEFELKKQELVLKKQELELKKQELDLKSKEVDLKSKELDLKKMVQEEAIVNADFNRMSLLQKDYCNQIIAQRLYS